MKIIRFINEQLMLLFSRDFISNTRSLTVEQSKYALVVLLLLGSCLSGCLSESPSKASISLNVSADSYNGTLFESYADGEKISSTNLTVEFDFSLTSSSSQLVTFGLDTMDGREPVTINAMNDSLIQVEFFNHGIYDVTAFAIDEQNVQKNQTISIHVELSIDWVESNTYEPKALAFDPIPLNGGPNPSMIEVNSVVENPSLLEEFETGAQSVQITWNIVDEQNDVCQKKTTQIQDGDSGDWYTIHFNTYQAHQLTISYDDGQDSINVHHSLTLLYED